MPDQLESSRFLMTYMKAIFFCHCQFLELLKLELCFTSYLDPRKTEQHRTIITFASHFDQLKNNIN